MTLSTRLTIAGLALGAALLGLMVEQGRPAHGQDEVVDIPALIVDAAERWQLPAHRLLCIARRESGYRPYAVSPWGHVGIWQWDWRTWAWASERAGYEGASPFDPWASTEVAAWLMSEPGGWWHWSTAGACW